MAAHFECQKAKIKKIVSINEFRGKIKLVIE